MISRRSEFNYNNYYYTHFDMPSQLAKIRQRRLDSKARYAAHREEVLEKKRKQYAENREVKLIVYKFILRWSLLYLIIILYIYIYVIYIVHLQVLYTKI